MNAGFQTDRAVGQARCLGTGVSPADRNVGETADRNVCATVEGQVHGTTVMP